MKENLAVLIMGSGADREHANKIAAKLEKFSIPSVSRIASAHKSPEKLLGILREFDQRDANIVYVTIAGMSNALSGMVDFATVRPVVACPPPSDAFGGVDIYSSLRMPGGVAPALILDPGNAALFVAKIFGTTSGAARDAIRDFHNEAKLKIERDDGEALGNQTTRSDAK